MAKFRNNQSSDVIVKLTADTTQFEASLDRVKEKILRVLANLDDLSARLSRLVPENDPEK